MDGIRIVLAALLPGIIATAACRQSSRYYRQMEIETTTLTVKLSDPFPGLYFGASGDYFFQFVSSDGRSTLDHDETSGEEPETIRYSAFFLDAQNHIQTRTKYQELLRGPFGTVYAKTTYFYADEYREKWTDFETAPYMNDLRHEPARTIVETHVEATRQLSAVSVIRIVRAPPEYLIASANYAPDGHLESLSVNGSKRGDWVHTNYIPNPGNAFQVGRMIGDRPATRELFGLPAVFPVAEYLKVRVSPFGPSDFPRIMDAVNFHYERNRWVVQDVFDAEIQATRRVLAYKVTREDQVLDPIDRQRLFGQFPYTRKHIIQ